MNTLCLSASMLQNIALRTHQDEKIARLLSAVESSVNGEVIEDSKQFIYLRVIDEMTVLHFQMFEFLTNINDHKAQHHMDHLSGAGRLWEKSSP